MALFHRIVQRRWAAVALDGEGARKYGGRWNPPGTGAVYLAESRALAALEIIVHAPREALRLEWRVVSIEIPDSWIAEIPLAEFPADWRAQPFSDGARRQGAEWLRRGAKPAYLLRSVIVPEEKSLLLNPAHVEFRNLGLWKPEMFTFDPRLAG